jgi:hypothetical protein
MIIKPGIKTLKIFIIQPPSGKILCHPPQNLFFYIKKNDIFQEKFIFNALINGLMIELYIRKVDYGNKLGYYGGEHQDDIVAD